MKNINELIKEIQPYFPGDLIKTSRNAAYLKSLTWVSFLDIVAGGERLSKANRIPLDEYVICRIHKDFVISLVLPISKEECYKIAKKWFNINSPCILDYGGARGSASLVYNFEITDDQQKLEYQMLYFS